MSWKLNKDKAINNFLEVYRRERDGKFKELDIEFIKSLETDDLNKKLEVTSRKTKLREFPSTIKYEDFSTIEELRKLWPTDLLNLPDSW